MLMRRWIRFGHQMNPRIPKRHRQKVCRRPATFAGERFLLGAAPRKMRLLVLLFSRCLLSCSSLARSAWRSRLLLQGQVLLWKPVLVAGKQPRLDLIVGHSHQAVASGEEGTVLLPRLVIVHSLVLECQGLFGVQAQDFSI